MLANSPVAFASREKPWYEVANTRSAAQLAFPGHTQSPQVHTNFNANTFIQDYYLDGNEFDNDAIPDGAAATALQAKVRIAFSFYSTKAIPNESGSPEGGSDYPEHWMCNITLLEVLQTGMGYSPGQEFGSSGHLRDTTRVLLVLCLHTSLLMAQVSRWMVVALAPSR